MLVLGVETSCDETGVALYHTEKGLLGECLYSQVETHAEYGGVVPELASRDHVRKLLPLLHQLLDEAELGLADLDAIAYTAGPGLIGALLVGVTFSQTLAWSLSIPALPVHHMEGHLLVPMLDEDPPAYPFVALLVSGGHTMLVNVAGLGAYEVIGDTLDDAVGEAFDKTAKLLGLDYPGGPALAAMASSGDPQQFVFPRPMTTRPGLDFSFSGLKTFARTCYEKHKDQANVKQDIAIAFELAVVDTLLIKCRRALKQTHCTRLVVAGGVGANQRLRAVLRSALAESGTQVFFPPPQLCTDNGVMIALVGALRLKAGAKGVRDFTARPRWDLARKHIEGG